MNKETELRIALTNLLKAIEVAEKEGCIDHLDCCDDGGNFWYEAIEKAKESLGAMYSFESDK